VSLRLIPPLHHQGSWQMAIDSWLLDQAVALHRAGRPSEPSSCGAVLRFYSWAAPTLSLGFHQRELQPHWLALQNAGVLDLVRRPSGGRAVLHHRELTYALIWPGAPAQRRQAYRQACLWLQQAFSRLGLPLRWGDGSGLPETASCFASSSVADLMHVNGAKRIGNAQLWRRGVLLQHGSILLEPDRALWREVLGEEPPDLPPLPCDRETLIAGLRQAALDHLPTASAGWQEKPLAAQEWSLIREQLHRYSIQAAPPPEDGDRG